jgi:hypothetical protein
MKRFWICFWLLLLSCRTFAIEKGDVEYIGGTAPGLSDGTIGKFDTTGDTALVFESDGKKISISYASIDSHEYSKVVARHLGVLPAIVVGLLKARQHRHHIRISYRDSTDTSQVVVFEIPKDRVQTLQAILDARSRRSGKFLPCGGVPCSR